MGAQQRANLAASGLRLEAPVTSLAARYVEEVDPQDGVTKATLHADDTKHLALAMKSFAAKGKKQREALGTVMCLPTATSPVGANAYERASLFKTFVNNHLVVEMDVVRRNKRMVELLWYVCVHPKSVQYSTIINQAR